MYPHHNQAQGFVIKVRVQPACQRDDMTADDFVRPQTGREGWGAVVRGEEGDSGDGGVYVCCVKARGWGSGVGKGEEIGGAFTGGLKIMEVGRDGGLEAAVEPALL